MHEYKIEAKIHEETKTICEVLEKMSEEFAASIDNTKPEDLHAAGMITDMIKDLAEAKEKIVKACYYKKILCAMEEEKEEEEEEEKLFFRMWKEEHKDEYNRMREEYGEEDGERRFYDNYRHANGRFARKGTGMYEPRKSGRRHYQEPPYYHMIPEYVMTPDMMREHDPEYWRDMDRKNGKMYFTETMPTVGRTSDVGRMDSMRDHREGRSGQSRRTYMETKEIHKDGTAEDKQSRLKDLDCYMNELNEDMKELIKDMTPEERTMLKQKMAKLNTLI